MSLHREVSVVSDYLPKVASDPQILLAQDDSPGVWDHSRVHMYLVVGLCKLGTTFCASFEPQRCKILVYTAAGACMGTVHKIASTWNRLEEKIDFSWVCLSYPRFTDHLLFKTEFCCSKGWS